MEGEKPVLLWITGVVFLSLRLVQKPVELSAERIVRAEDEKGVTIERWERWSITELLQGKVVLHTEERKLVVGAVDGRSERQKRGVCGERRKARRKQDVVNKKFSASIAQNVCTLVSLKVISTTRSHLSGQLYRQFYQL
jgi:hypothetical protein